MSETPIPSRGCRTLRRAMPSDLDAVDAFCAEARRTMVELGMSGEIFPVAMLLHESLVNAIVHGNKRAVGKRVCVTVRLGTRWIVLRVTDEGAGFDWRRPDATVPGVESTGGRGLPIYAMYADTVSFNECGNQVTLVRKRGGRST